MRCAAIMFSALFILSLMAPPASSADSGPCPGVDDGSCILCSGTPCMNQWDATICPGTNVDPYGPLMWIAESDKGCTCYCPYSLYTEYYARLCAAKSCPATCQGNTIYSNGYCDATTRGQCAYDTGYCENGCDSSGMKCASTNPPPIDTAPETTREVPCGDDYCDTAYGESCAGCPEDCTCDSGESCSPSAKGADYMGCLSPQAPKPDEPPEPAKDTTGMCGGKECAASCYMTRDFDYRNRQMVPAEYSFIPDGCQGDDCHYKVVFCRTGCNDATGRCMPAVASSADGCVQDGEYVVQSGSGKVPLVRIVTTEEKSDSVEMPAGSGEKHCAGDFITTDSETKVWIKHRNGRVSYIGPNSQYVDGARGDNVVEAKGTVQIKDPGAPGEDEMNIVTLVPLGIAVDIQKGTDYGTSKYADKQLRDFYSDNALMKQKLPAEYILESLVIKQHSNVIYRITDTSVDIVVLEGEATVTDLKTGSSVQVPQGSEFVHATGSQISQDDVREVDVSLFEDNAASVPDSGTGCCASGMVLAFSALAAMFRGGDAASKG